MPLRYDLIDLRLFLHVAEAANITHGARRSNMSLAAASERIRAMEATLGTELLVRGRRGVRLTPSRIHAPPPRPGRRPAAAADAR